MALLLSEYALTPDIFDSSSYQHEEICAARLENLRNVCLEAALVRNLHDGEWQKVFLNSERPWHRRSKELLKKMIQQKRLRNVSAALNYIPKSDDDWCREAIASSKYDPMTGIISTANVLEKVDPHPLLNRIDRLNNASNGIFQNNSIRLARCYSDYETNLQLVMQSANSVMFIDPYLDPSKARYSEFIKILLLASKRKVMPKLEIHRVIGTDSERHVNSLSAKNWECCFRDNWSCNLENTGLKVEVFLWDKYHDRYLISDIIGILIPNGFDTSNNPNDFTTWTRLTRNDRDDVCREFDPATNRHGLLGRFIIQ